jgi:NADPH-dependent glutamate synthase beta subunit-like oxidoreductase/NAD-dependent dihydropyrimidine dehydrogenase PreA subunit
VGTDAAAYVALLAEGRVAEAYDVARQHNPFASVCGRICSAPCERACRRGVVDTAVSIRALKRVLCDAHGAEKGPASRWALAVGSVPPITRPSVGIIGSGPAGLAAAHDLRLAGHAVTVYEAMDRPGGMMRFGIPAFRLPRTVLEAEIDAILALGITLELGCAIGRDLAFADLLARHAAVLVTVGCQQGRALAAPGAGLPGVMRAVDFLRRENARVDGAPEASLALPTGDVVVIGGGSVAFDAARVAWRAPTAYDGQTALDAARAASRAMRTTAEHAVTGAPIAGTSTAGVSTARRVTLVAPEPRAKLPVPAEELHEAGLEGVQLRDGVGVVRILGDAEVTSVEIAPVVSLFDAGGRFAPQLDLSRTTQLDARTIVLAIGQQSDTDFLSDVPTVERTAWGGVRVNEALQSSDPRVWAAGDVATGPRDLIDAVAAGQHAARGIAAALRGATPSDEALPAGRRAIEAPTVCAAPPLRHETRFWSRYDDLARTALPVLPPAARDERAEVEHALGLDDGRAEGARCLRCDEQLQFAPVRCIACALCVDVCPQASLALEPTRAGALALLFDDETCIRCGLCVHRCPTDALHFTLAPSSTMPSFGAPLPPPLSHA